jgi:hypothetical protein
MSDRRTPQEKKEHDKYVKGRFERWEKAGEEQTRQTFKEVIGPQTIKPLPEENKSTLLGSLVDGIFKMLRPVASVALPPKTTAQRTPDRTDDLMKRVPGWALIVCTILGGLIGLGVGASSGTAGTAVDTFLGAFVGLLIIPAVIRYRILLLGGLVLLIIWVITHVR